MNFILEQASDLISKTYGLILTGAGIWAGWFFKKSRALKKADDESASANMVKEWVSAIDTATSPFKDEIAHMRNEFKILQESYMELRIEVGILKRDNERKDAHIRQLEEENRTLKQRLYEYEARKLPQTNTEAPKSNGRPGHIAHPDINCGHPICTDK